MMMHETDLYDGVYIQLADKANRGNNYICCTIPFANRLYHFYQIQKVFSVQYKIVLIGILSTVDFAHTCSCATCPCCPFRSNLTTITFSKELEDTETQYIANG